MIPNCPNVSCLEYINFNESNVLETLSFIGGEQQYQYPGENNRNALAAFLKNPSPASTEKKPAEIPWSEEPSEVNHLTVSTFDSFIAENPSVMVSA